MDSANAREIQQTIGNYEILELVGTGGLGEVYKASNRRTGEIVALKRLHDQYQDNPKLLGLFHKEIMIHSRVAHKHCIRFIEADLTPPNAHIVTNFIDGYNCHNLIRQVGAVPPLIACCIILDMLQGLEHLHCLDIVHSDITPSNIMVERTGRVLLADFGLSCHQEVEDYAGMTVGTPGYQSPERLRHEPMSVQADIYCTGIILHEMLRGERLFASMTEKEIVSRMGRLDLNWIDTGEKGLDKLLKQTLATALSVKIARRFPTARDFMYAIYHCLRPFNIRYTRRAILQWMVDQRLTEVPAAPPQQRIYVRPPA